MIFSNKYDLHYSDVTAEARSIISRFTLNQFTLLNKEMATEMVKYIDRPDVLSEIFYQIYDAFNYSSVLRLALLFFNNLNDLQIQKIGGNYIGNQFLEHFASLFLNSEADTRQLLEAFFKISFESLYNKIRRNWTMQNSMRVKPFAGDIVPNNTGISDRFEKGHDGIHIRSPKEGGNVMTIEALQGIVIRQYIQDPPSPESGNYNLYAVNVLLKNGIVVIYKDLLTVAPKLQRLTLGKEYWTKTKNPKPTSNLIISANDLVGTIRPWKKDDLQNTKTDIGLHLTFLKKFEYLDAYNKSVRANESRFLYFYIFPCSEESPVRCL